MIEEEKNYVISITYPKTNIKKLNQRIKNDILKEIKKIKERLFETVVSCVYVHIWEAAVFPEKRFWNCWVASKNLG